MRCQGHIGTTTSRTTRQQREQHGQHGHRSEDAEQHAALQPPHVRVRSTEPESHLPHLTYGPSRDGNMDSPDRPEKIELVSDGTRRTPTVNVTRIITACTP